jgi:16S rRNA (uracil1498-N3)-methyltransferase
MTVTRLLWPGAALAPGDLEIPADVAHHARVARVAPGNPLEVLDLAGNVAQGSLLAWRGRVCLLRVDTVVTGRGEPAAPLLLGLGVLHTQAFDWAVEKATELGATEVVPLLTARAQGGRHEGRVSRWQRVADAAVSQCGRSRPPRVAAPEPLDIFLRRPLGLGLLADPGGTVPAARSLVGPLVVLVGPEGGLTPEEVASAIGAGYLRLALGPRILRAETASLAALTLAQQLVGWL